MKKRSKPCYECYEGICEETIEDFSLDPEDPSAPIVPLAKVLKCNKCGEASISANSFEYVAQYLSDLENRQRLSRDLEEPLPFAKDLNKEYINIFDLPELNSAIFTYSNSARGRRSHIVGSMFQELKQHTDYENISVRNSRVKNEYELLGYTRNPPFQSEEAFFDRYGEGRKHWGLMVLLENSKVWVHIYSPISNKEK